jgi:hypothetical protein
MSDMETGPHMHVGLAAIYHLACPTDVLSVQHMAAGKYHPFWNTDSPKAYITPRSNFSLPVSTATW